MLSHGDLGLGDGEDGDRFSSWRLEESFSPTLAQQGLAQQAFIRDAAVSRVGLGGTNYAVGLGGSRPHNGDGAASSPRSLQLAVAINDHSTLSRSSGDYASLDQPLLMRHPHV